MTTPSIDIRPFSPQSASAAEFAALHACDQRLRAETLPDDPPMPLDEYIQHLLTTPPFIEVRFWAAWEPATQSVVGQGNADFLRMGENEHLAFCGLGVLPEYRRQGLSRRLLALLAEAAQAENRRLMQGRTNARVPAGEALIVRLGAARGQENHVNQLKIADLNRALIQQWQARGVERAGELELGCWMGPYPEEQLTAIAKLGEVMNQEPRGTLEIEDSHFTPEHLRQMEKSRAATGTERWTMYVTERATHTFAGYTEVFWNPNRPTILNQGPTGVFPQYRNRGLGRWLKAAMLDKVLRDRPQVQVIRTGNADVNAAMLKINQELGFQPYLANTIWQVATAKVLAYLAQR